MTYAKVIINTIPKTNLLVTFLTTALADNTIEGYLAHLAGNFPSSLIPGQRPSGSGLEYPCP